MSEEYGSLLSPDYFVGHTQSLKERVAEAVRKIYQQKEYWKLPEYHEGMTGEEIIKLAEKLKKQI